MRKIKDGLVLFYCKAGTLYPVALTADQHGMLQLMGHAFEPLKVVDMPQGQAEDLMKRRKAALAGGDSE